MVIDSTHFRHFPCFCQTDCHGSHLGTLRCPECVLSLPRWRPSGPPTHAAYAQTWPRQREVWREVGTEGRSATGGGFSSGWERLPVAPDSPAPRAPPRPVPPLTPGGPRLPLLLTPLLPLKQRLPVQPLPSRAHCPLVAQGGLLPPHPVSAGQEDGPLLPAGRCFHGRTLPDTDFPLGHSYSLCQSAVSCAVRCGPLSWMKREAERALPAPCVRRREHVALRRVGEARAGLARTGAVSFWKILLRCLRCWGREHLFPEACFCIIFALPQLGRVLYAITV